MSSATAQVRSDGTESLECKGPDILKIHSHLDLLRKYHVQRYADNTACYPEEKPSWQKTPGQQDSRTAGQQDSRKTPGQQDSRTAGQQDSRTAGQQESWRPCCPQRHHVKSVAAVFVLNRFERVFLTKVIINS